MKIPMPGRPVRGSRSGAPLMALLDLLGRNWSMGILWKLCEDCPLKFREIQRRCETVSPTILNTRLKELSRAGLVARTQEGYVATELGRDLFRLLRPLRRWSHKWAQSITGTINVDRPRDRD